MKTIAKYLITFVTLTTPFAIVVESFSPYSQMLSRDTQITCHNNRSLVKTYFSKSVTMTNDDMDESTYRYILTKARECAFSDTGTSGEAKRFLRQILELESACISGTLAGNEICENVDEMAVVVSHLREKAKKNVTVSWHDIDAASTIGGLVILSMTFAIVAESHWPDDVVTQFTLQEWMWAAKGGYLNNMVSHFIRNGGL